MKGFILLTNGKNGESKSLMNVNVIQHAFTFDNVEEENGTSYKGEYPYGNTVVQITCGGMKGCESYVVRETIEELADLIAAAE
jgi:hypothetical protein